MTYRLTTASGIVVYVDEADLELIAAYFTLQGSPPISVEVAEEPPMVATLTGPRAG